MFDLYVVVPSCIFFDIEGKLFNLLLNLFKRLILLKNFKTISQLDTDLIKVFVASILHILHQIKHLLLVNDVFVHLVIETLVHGFLWFTKPS